MWEDKEVYVINDKDELVNLMTGEVLEEKTYSMVVIVKIKLKKIYKRIIVCVVDKEVPSDVALSCLRKYVAPQRPDLAPNQIEIRQFIPAPSDPDYSFFKEVPELDRARISEEGVYEYKMGGY